MGQKIIILHQTGNVSFAVVLLAETTCPIAQGEHQSALECLARFDLLIAFAGETLKKMQGRGDVQLVVL